MPDKSSIEKSKVELSNILDKIKDPKSPVGIDATLTHAIIIDYLIQIDNRLKNLENKS